MEVDTQALMASVSELVTTWGLRVVGAIAVLAVGWLLAGALRRGVAGSLERSGIDQTLTPFLSGLAYYLALAAVVIAVMNLFGVPTTSFVAVLGAGGLAVGLALQGTLSNFAAGFMLMLFRPIRNGDYVEVAGSEGTVVEVGAFATVLNTLDNIRITIPNAETWGNTIKNLTMNDERRVDLTFSISYRDDIGRATETIRGILASDPRLLESPGALVVVWELGESSVDLLVAPWVRPADYWDVRFDLTRQIKEALESAGLTIPFPQRDLHLVSNEAQVGRSV